MKLLSQSLIILMISLTLTGCNNWAGLSRSKRSSNLGVAMGHRRGAAFAQTYTIKNSIAPGFDPSKRYTPTTKDITLVDHLFFFQVMGVDKKVTIIYKLPLTIEKNRSQLRNYFSQYVGYIMPNGDKAIHINLVWNEERLINVDSDYAPATNSDSRNWQVNVNLTNQKVMNVKVND
jgi:hypothetical protein